MLQELLSRLRHRQEETYYNHGDGFNQGLPRDITKKYYFYSGKEATKHMDVAQMKTLDDKLAAWPKKKSNDIDQLLHQLDPKLSSEMWEYFDSLLGPSPNPARAGRIHTSTGIYKDHVSAFYGHLGMFFVYQG